MNNPHVSLNFFPPRGALTVKAPHLCVSLFFLLIVLCVCAPSPARAQAGSGYTLYGDLKVDDSKVEEKKLITFDVILYYLDGRVFSRQRVPNNGRYRFGGLRPSEYDLAIELDTQEIARLRVNLGAAIGPAADVRQDVELEWKATAAGSGAPAKKQTISAADFYVRPPANKSLFEKAQQAIDKKKYDEGAALLKQLLDADGKDFQAWTELGTTYLLLDKKSDAEKSYERALEAKPTFFLALLNLGRTRVSQKKYEEAIEPLTRAVALQPQSAESNFLLGETYLQAKKGSKAVGHLNEAARLGRADAHLRLAALYHAAGLKERAVAEYELFLAKEPGHPDKAKLEKYIKENKKQ